MDKKTIILNAALDLIDAQGIHNAPMAKIAKDANVAAGTLYLYFENKQVLVDELYTSIKSDMSKSILELVNKAETFEEKLYMCWRGFLDYFMENPKKTRFLDIYSCSSYISTQLVDSNYKLFDVYINMIKEAIEKKIIKDLPVVTILSYVIGPIKELQDQHETLGVEIDEEIIKSMYDILLHGIAG